VKDNLSQLHAAQLLDSINLPNRDARRHRRLLRSLVSLALGGVIWLGMVLLGQFLGIAAMPFLYGLVLMGLAATVLIGFYVRYFMR
jgi:hypothetical protein